MDKCWNVLFLLDAKMAEGPICQKPKVIVILMGTSSGTPFWRKLLSLLKVVFRLFNFDARCYESSNSRGIYFHQLVYLRLSIAHCHKIHQIVDKVTWGSALEAVCNEFVEMNFSKIRG